MEAETPEEPTLVADAETPLAQILDRMAPTLFNQPDLVGVVIRDGDETIGMIPRWRLLELAADPNVRRGSLELAGDPQTRARYFVCSEGHWKELITFYDPDDPPRCPKCGRKLVEED
jgi:hypothetical protein